MSRPHADELLAAYHDRVRTDVGALPEGLVVEHDGPVYRIIGFAHGGFVGYRDVGHLPPEELDALIARQREVFAARGQRVEWKHHAYDRPADLPERLIAAGFEPEEPETVVIGRVADVAGEPQLPDGVRVRESEGRRDLDRIAGLHTAVWGEEWDWLADELEQEQAADPESISIFVAEAGDTVVCAGWIRFLPGTGFATLWGGSTLPEWRRKGIYRALLAARGRVAAERGYEYLQVDASEDSRPILERLGFVPVTTTTPYVWRPPPP